MCTVQNFQIYSNILARTISHFFWSLSLFLFFSTSLPSSSTGWSVCMQKLYWCLSKWLRTMTILPRNWVVGSNRFTHTSHTNFYVSIYVLHCSNCFSLIRIPGTVLFQSIVLAILFVLFRFVSYTYLHISNVLLHTNEQKKKIIFFIPSFYFSTFCCCCCCWMEEATEKKRRAKKNESKCAMCDAQPIKYIVCAFYSDIRQAFGE